MTAGKTPAGKIDSMKYALIIPDGAADEPQPSLGGRTPLQAARTPNMDAIAREGMIGQADHVPASMPSGSDVGTMSLFGYDPRKYHTGRAPIEAAAQGIQLGPLDWAIRCNLVHVADGRMRSFTAGQIPSDLAHELVGLLQKDQCGSPTWKFHTGVSYRNLLIYRSRGEIRAFAAETKTAPPHDIPDELVESHLPQGPGSAELRDLMDRSRSILAGSARNQERSSSGGAFRDADLAVGSGKDAGASSPFASDSAKRRPSSRRSISCAGWLDSWDGR